MARLRARRSLRGGRCGVTPGPVDAYLSRLERELRRRGIEDARIVEEAREHLLDAVEDGRQRGLSMMTRSVKRSTGLARPRLSRRTSFAERDRMTNRFVAVLETVWHRKWWILAPTVLTAVVTSVMSYYFLPTRYRSESIIRIVSPRVPAEYVRPRRPIAPARGSAHQTGPFEPHASREDY